jgi:hypothetical protein
MLNLQVSRLSVMKEFTIGAKVHLVALPPYLKSADPMPMLRPADILQVGDAGTVLDRRPGGYWAVRFEKGAFLLDSQYLEIVQN